MNTINRRSFMRSVVAAGLLAGGMGAGAVQADINPELAAAIRAQGHQAIQSIRAETVQLLHQSAGRLSVPGVRTGPVELVREYPAEEKDAEVSTALRLDLLGMALQATSLEGLHRIILVVPSRAINGNKAGLE